MKKAISVIMLAAFIVFALCSCSGGKSDADAAQKPAEPVQTSELLHVTLEQFSFVEWNDEYGRVLSTCEYCVPALTDDSAAAYPELSEALSALSEENKADMKSAYDESIVLAADNVENMGEYFEKCEISQHITVRRADSAVLSLLYEHESFTGGAHGMYGLTGRNFDAQSGRELKLSDVVADMSMLPSIAGEQLEKYCGDTEFYEDLDLEAYFEEYGEYIGWTLDYNGVTLYFNPYEIAPYAYGVQAVPIPFADYPDLFSDEYADAPDAYAVSLPCFTPFYYDAGGDGTLNRIEISGDTDEYGAYTDVYLSVDGDGITDDTESYSWTPVLMHTAGGDYIYVFGQDLDGTPITLIYDISDGRANKAGETLLALPAIYAGAEADDDEVYRAMHEVPTDPGAMRLDALVSDITADRGWDVFRVTEGGMPEGTNGFYTVTVPTSYKLLSDLEVSVLDENGITSKDSMTLEAGEIVVRVRTDNETYSDLCLSDGETVVRASFERTADGVYFGGAESGEVFSPYFPEYDTEADGLWNPVVIQRQVLFDEGFMCGVVFLGYVDRAANDIEQYRGYYSSLFIESGYAEDFEFLLSVPKERFVCVPDGEELYLVIPRDENAEVRVNEWYIDEENDFTGEPGDVLYESQSGTPFLLKCNKSDIMPDALVTVYDSGGETLEWNPSISLMDGHVVTVSNLKYVYDFTHYNDTEEVSG
ncbi:MAG: DUF3298 domain-containing protein [Clostridia bacterium]|nr:DUF3298 domain-containing protein [Clostridia bacterium]